MATQINHDALDDFNQATLESFEMPEWGDISLPLQHYTFARILKKHRAKSANGPNYNFKLRVRNQGNARVSGLWATDDVQHKNVLTEGKVYWAMVTSGHNWDIGQDAFQGGKQRIIDELRLGYEGMFLDYFELMETKIWTAPASSTTTPRSPAGFPWWLQSSSTAAVGFNGGDPSGWAAGAGEILTSTYDRWKNCTYTYAQVSDTDFIAKTVKAMDFCHFESPFEYKHLGEGDPDWSIFTVYPVKEKARVLLNASNDNIQQDLGRYYGPVMLKGVPIQWVPALTDSASDAYDSANPVYGVNWQTFEWKYKKGWDRRIHKPVRRANSHNVRDQFMDTWGNLACIDRRRNFRAYDSTA
ncbi:MAG: hypothetical protein ACYS5V_04170 [Planctomycetota bacterium]|jgi:hypothetical protein